MLEKLRLNKADKYQLMLATSYIAEMLVNFIEGKECSLELGCEKGNIATWDDLVIINAQGVYEHVQVKRQNGDFCTKQVVRGKKQNSNEDQKLSTLDETMLGLANWVKSNGDDASNYKRNFIIELPAGNPRIKTNTYKKPKTCSRTGKTSEEKKTSKFNIQNFKELCSQFNQYVTADGMKEQRKLCIQTDSLYLWLTTWCGFDDWNHIIKAMRLLKIKNSGLEDDVNDRTERALSRCFSNVSTVRRKIQGCIDENANYASSITPRLLLQELKDDLLPTVPSWTQYKSDIHRSWFINGTNDTRCREKIEKPSQVVEKLWGAVDQRHQIKIAAKAPDVLDDPFMKSLIHLAIHLPSLSTACFDELGAWKSVTKSSLHTLGVSEGDLSNDQLPWVSNERSLTPSIEDYELTTSDLRRKQAEALTKNMYTHTWSAICERLGQKIDGLGDTDLRDAVELKWKNWCAYLDQNHGVRDRLLSEMMHPICEGEDVPATLRVGLKTVDILADGFKMLLIVSVGLKRSDDVCDLSGKELRVLALDYWSGMAGKPRRICCLDEASEEIIGRERSPIIIMSSIKSPFTEVYDENIAFNQESSHNLSATHRPDILVTNDKKLRNLITRGNIEDIYKSLTDRQKIESSSQEASIKRAARL